MNHISDGAVAAPASAACTCANCPGSTLRAAADGLELRPVLLGHVAPALGRPVAEIERAWADLDGTLGLIDRVLPQPPAVCLGWRHRARANLVVSDLVDGVWVPRYHAAADAPLPHQALFIALLRVLANMRCSSMRAPG